MAAQWVPPVLVCLGVWLALRVLFFSGLWGSDDLHYLRFAALWDRTPVNHWEARLLFNGLTRVGLSLFGYGAVTAVVPALLGSFMLLSAVLAWSGRWGSPARMLWAGLLAAALPIDVSLSTTVSPYPLVTGLLAVGTVCMLWGSGSRLVRILGPLAFGLAVVTHLTSAYFIAVFSAVLLAFDRKAYLQPILMSAAAVAGCLALEAVVAYAAFGDPLLRLRTSLHGASLGTPRYPVFVEGRFNPGFVLWPFKTLLFSKAFGVALAAGLVAGIWRWKSLDRAHRIMLITVVAFSLWVSFGSRVPWEYKPFWRNIRFWQPLIPCVAALFAVGVTACRSRLARWAGVGVLAVCVLNLAGSGSWGQNVALSRALSNYAVQHPERMFVTDFHTANEMYLLNGLRTPANVVAVETGNRGHLLDPEAAFLSVSAATRSDALLVNPVNLERTGADADAGFAYLLKESEGETLFETGARYRDICRVLPFLKRHAWAIRNGPARVVACRPETEPAS